MPIPRLRCSLRRPMVAVAIIGIVHGVTSERHKRFRKIEDHHRAEFQKIASRLNSWRNDEAFWLRLEWHEPMRLEYERAARYPFLPVPPDPPEPD